MSLRKYGTFCPKDDAAKLLRRGVVLLAALLLVCTLMAGAVSAADWTDENNFNTSWYTTYESGTNFYIYDNKSFAAFSEKVSKNGTASDFSGKTVKLMNNIDLAEHNWTAIGSKDHPFNGTFDGGNHTISNVKVYAPDTDNQGLFGYSANSNNNKVVLKNIKIENIEVTGNASVGSLAGNPYTGQLIENCHVSGTIQIEGHWMVGGLAGHSYVSTITNCSVLGGQNSYVKGIHKQKDREGDNVGGLIGYRPEGSMTLSKCKTDIAVSGTRKVGGLVGALQYGNTVTGCTAAGTVELVYVSGYGSGNTLSAGALFGDVHPTNPKNKETVTKIEGSTASGSIILPPGNPPNGATVSIGLIGAVRSSDYNNQDDLTTLSNNVKDTTYAISAEALKDLVDTGYMNTAGIGTVTVEEDPSNPIIMLNPGTNRTNVTWTGDATNGYKLNISESGSYLLAAGFTTTNILITASGVTFDGGDKPITASSDKASNDNRLKVENQNNVMLRNLNMTITGTLLCNGGNGNHLGAVSIKNSESVTLQDSTINCSGAQNSGEQMINAVYFVGSDNAVITGNVITAGKGTSSTRCIVIDGGENAKISGNTLLMGEATGGVSKGVEIKGESNAAIISENRITSEHENSRAVEITVPINGKPSHTISENTISLDATKESSSVHVIFGTWPHTATVNSALTLTMENNKGTATHELAAYVLEGKDGLKGSTFAIKGNIYNPNLDANKDIHYLGGFTDPEYVTKDDSTVTHNNPDPYVPPQPQVSSGDGNMNNAFRVLFDTQGGSYVSPVTGLSYGDRVAEPANPVKDGYTFGGWYKDAACTQAWSFSDSIPGDMTLYAKWTSSGTAATATQTAQTTAKATTAPAATQAQSGTTAATSAPVSTTAAGAQPTLTQAPAPVLGGLLGLLAAGILLRRRE
ncbi:MAG: InlB B-repeat-containing protein [Methanocorpusculum sp.]|nr:InlB B-repeat-containing protein [Methanocorpusculum sp.]